MALNIGYFLTVAVLVQLTTQNTNVSRVCSPADIQFQHKYCIGSLNSSVIANEPDPIKALLLCVDFVNEHTDIPEYRLTLKCKDTLNCLLAMRETLHDCRYLPRNISNLGSDNFDLIESRMPYIKKTPQILDIISGILFVVGIMMNTFLSIILIRHKHARNDMMLVNLVVSDILSLVFNMILILSKSNYKYYPDIYNSGLHFFIFISQYSLVTIIFQRFRAVSIKTELGKEKALPNWVKITCLWMLGSLYVILHHFHVHIIETFSDGHKILIILIFLKFVIAGVIPIVLITVFSFLASSKLKKLTKNFPGERNHHLQRIKDRYFASKALVVLAILCAISYVPHSTFSIVLFYRHNNEDGEPLTNLWTYFETWKLITKISQTALFLNSALNPLVLYFLSSKFRRYFKAYLCCRTRDLDLARAIHL